MQRLFEWVPSGVTMDQASFVLGAFVGAGAATAIIVLATLSYIAIRDGAKAEERYRMRCEIERQLNQCDTWNVITPVGDDTRMVRR